MGWRVGCDEKSGRQTHLSRGYLVTYPGRYLGTDGVKDGC